MTPIIAGLGLIILGLVGAFFGYRIFRVLLPIYGGVAGFLLAWGWWREPNRVVLIWRHDSSKGF